MNKLKLLVLTVGVLAVAHAAPLCTPTGSIATLNNGGQGCDIIGLNFNSFVLTNTGGGSGLDAVGNIQVAPSGDNVTFNVNNGQGSPGGLQTQTLTFSVTLAALNPANGIFGASNSNGGTTVPNATIREVVCVGSIDVNGNCSSGLLWDNTSNGGESWATSFARATSVNVWRQSTTPQGATITGGSFDFSTPEPISILLVGCGLLGLGLMRKRNA